MLTGRNGECLYFCFGSVCCVRIDSKGMGKV